MFHKRLLLFPLLVFQAESFILQKKKLQMSADSRQAKLSIITKVFSITSIIFSFFFCSVFLFGSFAPFFFGGMMADKSHFPANCARLLILPIVPCTASVEKWRDS